jgi:phage terminase large subunit-like protein
MSNEDFLDPTSMYDEMEELAKVEQELIELQEEEVSTMTADILSRISWNAKQWQFMNSPCHEVLFSGANQIGKSTAARGYVAYHATGRYPDNWEGHKWRKPIRMAVLGKTKEDVRDIIVKELIGHPHNLGTGYIPKEDLEPFKERIVFSEKRHFFVSEIHVKHHTDGVYDGDTIIYVWTYGQGSSRPQGYPLEEVIQDEEPEYGSDKIHAELIARTNFTGGYYKCVMSPTNGATSMWIMFKDDESGERDFIPYSIEDATHISRERRQQIVNKWAGHIQESARIWGMAVVGEGVVYPVRDSDILTEEPDFYPPQNWPRVIGLDFPHTTGYFGAALLAYDKRNDIVYLERVYKAKEQVRAVYAEKLRSWGGNRIPIEWPHDGGVSFKGSHDQPIADYYKSQGLNMETDPAHYLDSQFRKTNAVIPVIEEIFDRMRTGRFKVCSGCEAFLLEKTTYRWKDGRPHKSSNYHNDVIDAVHKAMMRLLRGDLNDHNPAQAFRGDSRVAQRAGGFFNQRNRSRSLRGKIRTPGRYTPGDEFLQ